MENEKCEQNKYWTPWNQSTIGIFPLELSIRFPTMNTSNNDDNICFKLFIVST